MSVSRSWTAFVTELMLISFLISVYNWPAMFAKSVLIVSGIAGRQIHYVTINWGSLLTNTSTEDFVTWRIVAIFNQFLLNGES